MLTNAEIKRYSLSVANKTAMIYGEVTFANVKDLLTTTKNPTPHPTGISIARFSAIVVTLYNEGNKND